MMRSLKMSEKIELNLTQHVYKKVKAYVDKPDLFVQICQVALKRLGAVNPPEEKWLLEKLKDPNNQFKSLQTVINEASGISKKIEVKKSMREEVGYFLPTIDAIGGLERFMNTELRGVVCPFITVEGELLTLVRWKRGGRVEAKIPIDADYEMSPASQRRVPIPVFYKCKVLIQVSEPKEGGNGKKNYALQTIISVDPKSVMDLQTLQKSLVMNSIIPEQIPKLLENKELYQNEVVILRGVSWGKSNSLDIWKKSDKKIKIIPSDPTKLKKDSVGNPIYEYADAPPERDKIGQEFKQVKYGSEEKEVPVPVYTNRLFLNKDKVRDTMTLVLNNNQYGDPIVWIPSFKDIAEHAIQNFGNVHKPNEKEDVFSKLDDSGLRGNELLVVAKLSNYYKPKPNDPAFITLNSHMIAEARFPYIEKEDRELPLDITPFLKDETGNPLPVIGDFSKTEFTFTKAKNKEMPKDADLNLGASFEQLQEAQKQIQQQFVTPKKPEETSKAKIATETKESKWEPQFITWLKDLEKKFLQEGYLKESALDADLVIALQESDNVFAPGNPEYLQIFDEESGLEPAQELFEYWETNVIKRDKTVVDPKSNADMPEGVDIPDDAFEEEEEQLQQGAFEYPPEYEQFYAGIDEMFTTNEGIPMSQLAQDLTALMARLNHWKLEPSIDPDHPFFIKRVKGEGSAEEKQSLFQYWIKLSDQPIPVATVPKEPSKQEVEVKKEFNEEKFEALKTKVKEILDKMETIYQDKIPIDFFRPDFHQTLQNYGIVKMVDENHLKFVAVEETDPVAIKQHEAKTKLFVKYLKANHNEESGFFFNSERFVAALEQITKEQVEAKKEENKTTEDKSYVDEYKESYTEVNWSYEGLDAKTVKPLLKIAKTLGLRGYTKLKKNDLIISILEKKGIPIEIDKANLVKASEEPAPAPVKQEATVTTGLTPEQKKDVDDLKDTIKQYIQSGMSTNVSFDVLFTQFKGVLPQWVNKTHKQLVDDIIVVCQKEVEEDQTH